MYRQFAGPIIVVSCILLGASSLQHHWPIITDHFNKQLLKWLQSQFSRETLSSAKSFESLVESCDDHVTIMWWSSDVLQIFPGKSPSSRVPAFSVSLISWPNKFQVAFSKTDMKIPIATLKVIWWYGDMVIWNGLFDVTFFWYFTVMVTWW